MALQSAVNALPDAFKSGTNIVWSPEGIANLVRYIFTCANPTSALRAAASALVFNDDWMLPDLPASSGMKRAYGIAGPMSGFEATFLAKMQFWQKHGKEGEVIIDENIDNINGIIATFTDQMLQNVLTPDTLGCAFVVACFKSTWQTKMKTVSCTFQKRTGGERQVQGFTGKGAAHFTTDTARQTVFTIPYDTQDYIAMVVLPETESETVDWHDVIVASEYMKAIRSNGMEAVSFTMPSFSIESRINVDHLLATKCNIKSTRDLFAPETHGLQHTVTQVNRIIVDEHGTRAASFTAATFGRGISRTPHVEVDRPFGFAIVDRRTLRLEFAAMVEDPSQE